MNKNENEEAVFEIGVVIPRRVIQEIDESSDCACVLIKEFKKVGFVVERVVGIADEFIKVRFSQFLSILNPYASVFVCVCVYILVWQELFFVFLWIYYILSIQLILKFIYLFISYMLSCLKEFPFHA